MFKRISILLAAFAFSAAAQATLIDFTDKSWNIVDGKTTSTMFINTIGNVTLSSTGGYMTFNAGDRGGCVQGQSVNGLTCDGDGIGVWSDDEIHQGGNQTITVNFENAVNISDILLLDLFSSEQTGEIAIIDGNAYSGPNLTYGGFYATGFTGEGITSLIFSGNLDSFSDYALAAIDVEISPVPVPGTAILFGSALLGFFGFKRRRIA